MRMRKLLELWLLAFLSLPALTQEPPVPPAPAQAEAEAPAITPERVQAAWKDVLELCGEVGLAPGDAPQMELTTRSSLRKLLTEELQVQMLMLCGGDEAAARLQARQTAAAYARMMVAKYSWSQKKVLVCPESWGALAKSLGRPELLHDQVLRAVLAHELVHAADARAHRLDELLASRASDEELRALDAVIEGNAQRVARQLCERKGWTRGFDVFTASIGAPPAAVGDDPAASLMLRVLGAHVGTSYVQGELFMAALHASKGAEGIAAAFAKPPRDMGEIFNHQWYLDPQSRPRSTHDLEAGLDTLDDLQLEGAWKRTRVSVTPTVMMASMGDLPHEDIERILRALRLTRVLVLQPESQPSPRLVTLALMSMQSPGDAAAMITVEERVTRKKDETMTRGSVQVARAEYATCESGDAKGFACSKTMRVYGNEQELWMVALARGSLVAELTFVVEPCERDKMIAFAVRALEAAAGERVKQD